jgi:hypothetical protein
VAAPTSTHRYCSLGDSRSWTDLITNVCELSSTRVDEDFEALMGWGSLPRDLLPGFLHELTHHWCFLSPVGFVLAVLQLRARRTGVQLYNRVGDADALERRLADDVCRYEAAATILRPLAEGLALFAEFDAMSGPESSTLSMPCELTGAFFGFGEMRQGDTSLFVFDEAWRLPLRESRASYQCFRRKRSLLQQPLDPAAAGGYLGGYLTVRTLWLHLAREDRRLLNESDLFLMYLRSFFYDDRRLVRLLLEPRTDFAGEFEIMRHLAERFDRFARVSGADVRLYEEALKAGDGEIDGNAAALSRALLVDEDDHRRGNELSDALLAELEHQELETVDGLLRLWDAEILRNRDVMYLGSLPVDVSVDADETCTVTSAGGTSRRLHAAEGVERGTGPGWVDLFFSTLVGIKARASIVFRGEEEVATVFGGPDAITEGARQRFTGRRHNRRSFQSGTEEMNDYLAQAIDAAPWVRTEVEEARAAAADITAAIYQNMAIFDIDDERKEGVRAAMRTDGFLDILGWESELVDALALISLSWPLRLRRDGVAELLARRGLDLATALDSLAERSYNFGGSLVLEAGDTMLAAV